MSRTPPADVVNALRSGDDFLIVGHVDGDPDSIGSILGLRRILVSQNKRCLAVTPTPVPPMLDFLPDREHVLLPGEVAPGSWHHLIVLDCGVERTGDVADWTEQAASVINIDHHATNEGTGTHNWIDSSFAATAEMIARLRDVLGVPLDPPLATLLYTGLVGDTGSFRFSNTTPAVLRLAADLCEVGVDIEDVNTNLYERYSLPYVRLLALVLQTIQTAFGGRVVHARSTEEMRTAAGAGPDESDGFIQYLRLIRDADVAVLLSETEEDRIRVQLRSSASIDVAMIARSLGGGGHARAAGVKMRGSLDEVEAKVLSAIGEAFDSCDTGTART